MSSVESKSFLRTADRPESLPLQKKRSFRQGGDEPVVANTILAKVGRPLDHVQPSLNHDPFISLTAIPRYARACAGAPQSGGPPSQPCVASVKPERALGNTTRTGPVPFSADDPTELVPVIYLISFGFAGGRVRVHQRRRSLRLSIFDRNM